ncbi:MAG: tryptophan--tRNA ligase [Candidatus Kerfeldbacteria bacterium RIFCSPLOWO2_01_FULL_48_11]|uniref:Tryptophan--tRNA ligase n=1 Tax=Candidatus Kerfeldbacteria bacterium RIFCSPLOWO2_01_FULL_48_11 TaxID=1798543 RepID=A0A1G2B4P1_9BACT|nr:MAG: tryptophan--tRNA ligase [Candidatus Kerfeldbacteria bacterium RIFCSPLOWO2_01_FULL_48_11]HCJ52747.1 tryptophan--tRNA ligase [Candidatus Kerfeldbacteria bacterium]HCM68755.1 tryptophan--tRNA ligase [Candidatus Kerfeldbacteria bacterium]
MKRLVSGMQPSGQLHIGNYLGAIKNWLQLQEQYECVFGMYDLHAMTEGLAPEALKKNVLETAMDYLASGIDPQKSTLMVQSWVPEHTYLAWIFNTLTPVSWLERVPTYKDKSQQFAKNINMGLLDYPVLMAVDILLYKAVVVPVGEDQTAHIELTREIARTFNSRYGETFPEPKMISGPGARIMSLVDPTVKMSKSKGPNHYIALNDSPEIIKKKLASAVTDTGNDGKEPKRPGVANLFQLLNLFSKVETREKFETTYHKKTIRYAEVKATLAEDISSHFADFRNRRADLEKHPDKVLDILREGSAHAQTIARATLKEVKEKVGLL